jgi:hypothetical protein
LPDPALRVKSSNKSFRNNPLRHFLFHLNFPKLSGSETSGYQKKGGDNQIGYHLPGWGGVLLGKLNPSRLKITLMVRKTEPAPTLTGTKTNQPISMRK